MLLQSHHVNKRPKITLPPPLADRMRSSSLSKILGQDHIRPLLQAAHLPSIILWDPPGSDKTSTARALPPFPPHRFLSLSVVSSSLSELRSAIFEARRSRSSHRTVLFEDEIHRFSKTQLDALLPAIEDGSIVYLAAITENPSFHLTTPLLSRSRVLSLHPLKPDHVRTLLNRALDDHKNGLRVTTKLPVSVVYIK